MKKLVVVMLALGMALAAVGVQAADGEKKQLGKDDFVSTTLSDVFDKLGKFSSGEKSIVTSDYQDEETDFMGRKIKKRGASTGKKTALDEKLDAIP